MTNYNMYKINVCIIPEFKWKSYAILKEVALNTYDKSIKGMCILYLLFLSFI